MQLGRLARALSAQTIVGDASVEIAGLVFDSRRVAPGSLFVALRGGYVDGHDYLAAAAARGAVAAVVEQASPGLALRAQLIVPDTRAALAVLAAEFLGHPSKRFGVIGVTGTDGKTTTTYFLDALLTTAKLRTGLVGTVDVKVGRDWLGNPGRQTTPESLEVQTLLARMDEAGTDWAILESTSHGLAMHRLDCVAYDVAVMTNVTHEHLDFHGTFENYRSAKASLFRRLAARPAKAQPLFGVVNADDPSAEVFRAAADGVPCLGYSARGVAAEVVAEAVALGASGTTFTLRTPRGAVPVRLQLVGDFNVANALAAAAVGEGLGLPLPTIAAGLGSLAAVPGRLERIDAGQPFGVVVDYAHTPDSLAKMLRLLRPLTRGRLIAVFGSAGERDVAKRPIQGRVSAELADVTVATSEDPRFEDASEIVEQIAAGARAAGAMPGRSLFTEVDRLAAVRLAVGLARPGDMVLLAGKGHEQSIIVGAEKVPWDDRAAAWQVLAEHGWVGADARRDDSHGR